MLFTVPAEYARFVEHKVKLAIIEAELDKSYRQDEDPRIRNFASVPESLIDKDAEGSAIVVTL